jgi:hypothetical protein
MYRTGAGYVYTLGGSHLHADWVDGFGTTAGLKNPNYVALSATGCLFLDLKSSIALSEQAWCDVTGILVIGDTSNYRIRLLDAAGEISTP